MAEKSTITVELTPGELRDIVSGLARIADDYRGPAGTKILALAMRLRRVVEENDNLRSA